MEYNQSKLAVAMIAFTRLTSKITRLTMILST